MASQRLLELLRIGPVKGLDASVAGPYGDIEHGAACSNIDPRRAPGALTTARGRLHLVTLNGTGALDGLAELIPTRGQRYLVAGLGIGTVEAYDPDAGVQSAVANGLAFTQATQFGSVLYTDAGQQIGAAAGTTPLGAFKWQYVVDDTGFAIVSVVGSGQAYASATATVAGTFAAGETCTTTVAGTVVVYTVVAGDVGNATLHAAHIATALNNNPVIALSYNATSALGVVTVTALVAGSSHNADTFVCATNSALGTYVASGATFSGGLGPNAGATYYYAATVVVHPPLLQPGGGPNQESSPVGAVPPVGSPYPYQALSTAPNPNITVTGNNTDTWSGTLADGSPWYVNLYRMSSNQPIWYEVATGGTPTSSSIAQLTNGQAFGDTVADSVISANAALATDAAGNQTGAADQPPVSATDPCAIFGHKERMWALVIVQNADTNYAAQTQLWFSNYGQPWAFDKTQQVLLVGTDDTPNNSGTALYGDLPVAGVSLSSVGVLFKSRTMHILYGDDTATFVVRKVGSYGLASRSSLAVCQDVAYGLFDQGVFSFDGANAPQYLSARIKTLLESIPRAAWPYASGWFSDRSYYLSFPDTIPGPPVPTAQSIPTVYAGNASVAPGSATQITQQPQKNSSVPVTCRGTFHKPNPDPDTWFWSYFCTAGSVSAATWPVTVAVAPTNAATQLSFNAASIGGTADGAVLSLIGTDGTTVLQSFGTIVAGHTYSYSNAGALTGTYTWKVVPDVSGETGGVGDTPTAGTYTVTVTPTTTIPTTGSAAVNGPALVVQMLNCLAPTAVGTQLSLQLGNVNLPADINGSTAFQVQLTDATGKVWVTQTVGAAATLTFHDATAPASTYTWTVIAVATVIGTGTSTYACTANVTAGYWNLAGSANVVLVNPTPMTFIFHLPSQEWFTLPYATGAAVSSPTENNPLPAQQRLNAIFAARPSSLDLDCWEAAEQDLGANVVGVFSTQISDSGSSGVPAAPGKRKEYQYVYVCAPPTTPPVSVSLAIDPGLATPPNRTFPWTLNPAKNLTNTGTVPNDGSDSNKGFLAQLSVTLTSNETAPAVVYAAGVHGDIAENLIPYDDGGVT